MIAMSAESNQLLLLAQGAESKLFVDGDTLIKKRVKKSYRLKEIDEKLRTSRTKAEARMLKRASELINVPKVKKVSKYEIEMEYIKGSVLRDLLASNLEVMKEVGKAVAKLHSKNYIHGDLTTSNMILNDKIHIIDFGLSEVKDSIEAKAVDLHILKQALKAKHHDVYKQAWNNFKQGYKNKSVLERLKTVEARGRYKTKSCV